VNDVSAVNESVDPSMGKPTKKVKRTAAL
jgi:hypothetical protein